MAKFGIYIHIPFCKQACSYCNFYYSTSPNDKNTYTQALCQEIQWRIKDFSEHTLQSIYFGGGTPSMLLPQQIEKMIQTIFALVAKKNTSLEITLEANPNDINTDTLQAWKQIGINRISIGIQSFFDSHLKFMNRSHTAKQALQCIEDTKNQGFNNISIDLIFGFPLLQDTQLNTNLSITSKFQIPHISAYGLTIESKTLLAHQIKNRLLTPLDEAQMAKHFMLINDYWTQQNYQHYEISNYALPSFQSIHNSAYWNNAPYLGIGASAHSFIHNIRMWNVANHHIYCKSILTEKKLPLQTETLSPTQQFNEYIFLSLRQSCGLSLAYIVQQWGSDYLKPIHQKKTKFIHYGWIQEDFDCLKLTTIGKLYCDTIALDLLL